VKSDEENLRLATSTESVDAINAKFYGRFQFPYPPVAFDKPIDRAFESLMLNQSLGSWDHSRIPSNPRIWIAGCGTNQAVFTALRFPDADITATDLSAQSLETAARNARSLDICNVKFKQETINKASYAGEFDYVICTGVIHHNAEPDRPLKNLARALKRDGVLELMVYNRYHRIITTAFQKAIRLFGGNAENGDFELELLIAKKIIEGNKLRNLMAQSIREYTACPEAQLADALLQPVEHSYTVESMDELASACGLEMLVPCINQYDKSSGTFNWNLEFADPELQKFYDGFSDLRRWQISNHLMLETSPMIWFYLHRKDSRKPRKSESKLSQEFLDLRFRPSATSKLLFTRKENGEYAQGAHPVAYPGQHRDDVCQRIIETLDRSPSTTMRDVLDQLGVETNFSTVNKLRLSLTTNAFPFLIAIH